MAQEVKKREEDAPKEQLLPPVDKSAINRPGGAIFTMRTGKFSDDYATFVTMNRVGLSHIIRLQPMAEERVQDHGATAPRMQTVQGSGVRVQFFEGKYVTNDAWVIDQLLNNPKCKFDIDFTINPTDPTGFWRKHFPERFQFETKTEIVRKGSNINDQLRRGPMQAHRSTRAAMGMG